MKKLTLTLIAIISLCSANFSYGADRYVTLLKDTDDLTPLTQTIKADEVAFIYNLLYGNPGWAGTVTITKGTVTTLSLTSKLSDHDASRPIVVTGPCTITHSFANATARTMLTIKISPTPNIMGVKQ